ncbi:MAG TPA: hypothetical protein VGJ55_11760 [Pyrinomonadaceae bacterium]|jgi:hypothetical protein
MLKLADIAVYSPDNRLQLVAEVKGKTGATPEWAAQMRRNLLMHSAIPPARFFLLATPEHFYLWTDETESLEAKAPDSVVDARPIVDPYIKDTRISRNQISDSSLQLILTSWLSFIVNSKLTAENVAPSEKWLFDSGLYEAIKNGSIESEASS